MRLTLWGIALLLSGIVAGVLLGHFFTKFDFPHRFASQQNRLDTRIDRVDFQNVPLSQVIERLNRDHSANLGVNWRTLESVGIDENTSIFVQTQGLPLRKVLDLVCADAGAGTVKLSYRADDGIIFLSTAEELARETTVHIYDVRGLITDDHDLRQRMHRLIDPRRWEQMAKARRENSPLSEEASDSIDALVVAITETIDPDSWRDAGGTTGSIREFGGRLIIIQTPEAHTQIASLLNRLEKGT